MGYETRQIQNKIEVLRENANLLRTLKNLLDLSEESTYNLALKALYVATKDAQRELAQEAAEKTAQESKKSADRNAANSESAVRSIMDWLASDDDEDDENPGLFACIDIFCDDDDDDDGV